MDSNSTLPPNPPDSSWKGEFRCLKQDQFAMARYNDKLSGSHHCNAFPAAPKPKLRIDSWMATLLEDEKEQRPVSSSLQQGDLFHDSLIISGAESRPLNPWAAFGSVVLLSLFVLALIVIPLFHTDALPKRERLTILYLPPAGQASHLTRLPVPTSTSRNTPTNLRIPSAVHTTQEAPSTPVDTAAGVVGGVPGGVVGGIPGGVLGEVLRSTGNAPVLASTPAPAPKRIRVPAQVAEANLIHDVPPQYPAEAGRERIEGTVVLMAVIAKDGTVRDVRVESGLPLLAQAAIDAVKQWRYKPYLLNGEPIEVDSHITINFTLSRG
jgi:periplasmic protein TonB